MTRRLMAVAVLVAACNCGGGKKPGEHCSKSFDSLFGGNEGDCAAGLTCPIADGCTGTCMGTCRQLCTTDAGCPAGCGCIERLSSENGGDFVCAGPGC